MSTVPKAMLMAFSENGRRSSGASVSGIRNAAQAEMASAITPMQTKIMCHSANSITACPIDGATTGITMNTMKMSDMTSAI